MDHWSLDFFCLWSKKPIYQHPAQMNLLLKLNKILIKIK